MAIARTYTTSPEAPWKKPFALSDFGFRDDSWPRGLTLGLEEFNLTEAYLELKVAFVPCYRSHAYHESVNLGLFHRHNGQNYLYATLCGARQIKDSEIQEFRSKLIGSVDSLFQLSPGHQHRDLLKRGYEHCLAMNNILGQGNNGAFVVNVHYQELKLHFKDDTNLNHPIGIPTDYRGLMANVRGNLEVPCK